RRARSRGMPRLAALVDRALLRTRNHASVEVEGSRHLESNSRQIGRILIQPPLRFGLQDCGQLLPGRHWWAGFDQYMTLETGGNCAKMARPNLIKGLNFKALAMAGGALFAAGAPVLAQGVQPTAPRANPAAQAPMATPPAAQPQAAPPPPAPPPLPPVVWNVQQAQDLIYYIQQIGREGLDPSDYDIPGLQAAMASGDPVRLSQEATARFNRVSNDLALGHVARNSRIQWFVVDKDLDPASQ